MLKKHIGTHTHILPSIKQTKHVPLAGMSSYLPLAQEPFLSEENKQTPILLAHGDADQVVSVSKSEVLLCV